MLLLLFPGFLYLAILTWLFFTQTDTIFPSDRVGPVPAPPGAERLILTAASGDRLEGVHIPPSRASEAPVLLLGFGGNGGSATTMAGLLHDIYPSANIVVFHYRGYAPSGGSPSASALREDAALIFDAMHARFRPARTVAIGFSIGSGVASALAGTRALDGLILVTPFDSLTEVVAGHYPWAPVRLLLRHRLDSARYLQGRALPVAIVAAENDRLVVPARTAALRRALSNPVCDRTIAAADHDDIYGRPEFAPAMVECLERMVLAHP